MGSPVTVTITEDHPVVVEGIISWIEADPDHRIAVARIARDLDDLASSPAASVTILDLELGGRLIVADIPRLVAAGQRVVAFSGHTDPAIVLSVLDAGAHAYIAKDEGRDHLIEAVLAVAEDRPYVTPSQAKAILADTRPSAPGLSEQERQALLLWFQGMSKASVGQRMGISENTVRQYINRARTKYAAVGRSAPSKDALLARAIEDKIITPGEISQYTSRARQVGLSDPRPPGS